MKLLAPMLLAVFVSFLFGCVAPKLTSDQLQHANYPTPPSDYKATALRYFSNTLKDPNSAQYRGWMFSRAYLRVRPQQFGHVISVEVNAKNGYGGYTGFEHCWLWIPADNTVHNVSRVMDDLIVSTDVIQLDDEKIIKPPKSH